MFSPKNIELIKYKIKFYKKKWILNWLKKQKRLYVTYFDIIELKLQNVDIVET